MSYCVHCGVELNENADRCPLCNTPVLDPSRTPPTGNPDFFPSRPAQIAPVSKMGAAILITSMLLSVSLCCALLNLALKPQIHWSLFVAGAAAMLWIWSVLPILLRKLPLWIKLTIDVGAVGLYVWIISLALDGKVWFDGLAVPLLVFSAVTVCLLSWLLRRKHSMLSTVTMILAAIGIYCVEIELCGDWYFHHAIDLSWSLIVFACCVGLCIPLIVVRRVPSLREEVRRRFHF